MTSEMDAAGELREVACVVAHAGIDAVATVTGEELSRVAEWGGCWGQWRRNRVLSLDFSFILYRKKS